MFGEANSFCTSTEGSKVVVALNLETKTLQGGIAWANNKPGYGLLTWAVALRDLKVAIIQGGGICQLGNNERQQEQECLVTDTWKQLEVEASYAY